MVECLAPKQADRRSRLTVSAAIARHRHAAAELNEFTYYMRASLAEQEAAIVAEASALRDVALARHETRNSFPAKMRYMIDLSRLDNRDMDRLRAIRTAVELWLIERKRSD